MKIKNRKFFTAPDFSLPCMTMNSKTERQGEMALGMEQSRFIDLINDAYPRLSSLLRPSIGAIFATNYGCQDIMTSWVRVKVVVLMLIRG